MVVRLHKPYQDDFVGELRPSNRVEKGFGGSRTLNVKYGIMRWSCDDDQRLRMHSIWYPIDTQSSTLGTIPKYRESEDNNPLAVNSLTKPNTSCTGMGMSTNQQNAYSFW
jgi:hypothetical protein